MRRFSEKEVARLIFFFFFFREYFRDESDLFSIKPDIGLERVTEKYSAIVLLEETALISPALSILSRPVETIQLAFDTESTYMSIFIALYAEIKRNNIRMSSN